MCPVLDVQQLRLNANAFLILNNLQMARLVPFLPCMPKIVSFRDLLVWQKSMSVAERCYRVSRRFKREDQWVLGHEIRKSSVSIPSNIAEGFGRHYTPEYVHHLRISNGSNNELKTQVELGRRVEIVTEEEASILVADAEEIGRMLHGLIGSLTR